MAGLTSLNDDLLVRIFGCLPRLFPAMCLSVANLRLQRVWLAYNDKIVESILGPDIPACQEAVALAIAETNDPSTPPLPSRLRHPEVSSTETHPNKWLPYLFRNSGLASSACTAWKKFLKGLPNSNYRLAYNFTSPERSYYFIRLVVLAYNDPRFQPALQSVEETLPINMMRTHYEFCEFMCRYMSESEQARQGIAKAPEDMTFEDELEERVADDWEAALKSLWQALCKREKANETQVVATKRSISAVS
ncbi:hypothetical protein BDV96DRAFT_106098 [Lophiotrema nucula]|uniref:Uncharacterized protein n=1 Tax=Lophiotrema nucula TaxID=690887 RepID=A0A6A5Z3H9_9PLEO|nr:hypothetical protein BDV96DRAFT_106098 [Lophiotrema nucula]